MYHQKEKENKIGFYCFSKCCYIPIRGWETYGEIGRAPEDVAEPTLWKFMGENGVVECRRCEENCKTVYDLGLHIKNSCPYRKVMCETCNTLIVFKDYEEHKRQCKAYCFYCKEQLLVKTRTTLPVNETSFKWIKVHKLCIHEKDNVGIIKTDKKPLIVLDHFCSKKVLSECTICHKAITIDNILSHKDCTKMENDRF